MPVSNNEQGLTNPEPIQHEVELGNDKSPKKSAYKGRPYSPKRTLNLKKKERTGISPEVFCIVLALIMAFALIIEYFGVYKRYEDLAAREAQLQEMNDRLKQTQKDSEGLNELREWYRYYSYEGFDDTMIDKIVVLDMLEALIFDVYPNIKISGLSLGRTEVTFSILGLNEGEKEALYNSLTGYTSLIDSVSMSTINVENNIATVSVRIVLKSKGGND